jgi:HTH-type transcriptional regulator/antitoxin HipB
MKPDLNSVVSFHRKKAGLSQLDLAKLAGVGKTAVFDIEKGKPTVQMATVAKVLGALNINIQLTSPLMKEYERSFTSGGTREKS